MSRDASVEPFFYPPTVRPPRRPLKPVAFVRSFVRNPLETLPEAAYRQLVLVDRPTPRIKVAWISDPAAIDEILVDKYGRFRKNLVEQRVLGPVLGDGVLIAEGDAWRWQRRAVAPLMRPNDVANYVPTMVGAARELLREWGGNSTARVQPIDQAMVDLTFTIIARTMLKGGEPAEADLIKREGDAYLNHTSWELAFTLLRLPRWVPHPHKLRTWRAARRVRTAVTAIVRRRQQEQGADAASRDQAREPVGGEDGDLLSRLIQAEDPETGRTMSETQIVDNVVTLLAAGHETTARALGWTLYLLAAQPQWQERAREEVGAVTGGAPVTGADLARLAIIERVLKEAMRLYPPVAVIARTPTEPVELFGETFVPGDQLTVPIWCLHRNSQLWDDPDRFDPERFLPEREVGRPRTQFLPFGAGPRICLGMSFAMAEAKAILATLLQGARFELTDAPPPQPVSRVTVRPKDGLPLWVEKI